MWPFWTRNAPTKSTTLTLDEMVAAFHDGLNAKGIFMARMPDDDSSRDPVHYVYRSDLCHIVVEGEPVLVAPIEVSFKYGDARILFCDIAAAQGEITKWKPRSLGSRIVTRAPLHCLPESIARRAEQVLIAALASEKPVGDYVTPAGLRWNYDYEGDLLIRMYDTPIEPSLDEYLRLPKLPV